MKNFENPYEPCLTYVRQFNPSIGDLHTVVVDYEITAKDKKTFAKQRKGTIRKFQGECVEELLYTIDNFHTIRQDLKIDDNDIHNEFGKVLGHGPRKRWKELPKISSFSYSRDTNGLNEALSDFIKTYAKDTMAKDTMLSSLEHGSFRKPLETSVVEHINRCEMLFDYIDLLQGDRTTKISEKERKMYFFKSFPNAWKEAFIKTAKDLYSCDLEDMKEFMMRQKVSADSEDQKRKKQEEKKKKNNNNNNETSNKNNNRRNNRNNNYKSNRNDGGGKFQSKQISEDQQCPIHPGTKHTWGQCNRNTKNRRSVPYDKRRQQPNGNGQNQRRDGYYHQNSAYHPRTPYNNNNNNNNNNSNDGYSNHQPSAQVSFASQLSNGTSLPPPPPQNQHFNNQW